MSAHNPDSNVVPLHTIEPETDAAEQENGQETDVSPGNDNADEADVTEHTEAVEGSVSDEEPEDSDATSDDEAVEPDEEDIKRGMRLLEALLFASAEPLTERMLANRLPEHLNAKTLLKSLQQEYADRGVNLVRVGKSWAFRTAEDLAAVLNIEAEVSRKMSRATIETMAIVAYHQPVTRAEIEEIRGVSLSKGTLDTLFEKGWIKPRGRRETPGRPMTWGTTDEFLDHFGMQRVTDLPGMDELKAAGLLESGPALNVYRSRGSLAEHHENAANEENAETLDEEDPAALSPFAKTGEEDALPEVNDDVEVDEPLDPGAS